MKFNQLIVPESASELLPYDYFAANVQHLANKGSNSLVNSRAHMLVWFMLVVVFQTHVSNFLTVHRH